MIRIPAQPALMSSDRVLIWFSCGAASACAAKFALLAFEGDKKIEVLYCDTSKYEHPDNRRFISDCEKWFDKEIKFLRSETYADIFDVFDKTGWLVGRQMARCTIELKRAVREAYQEIGDVHVLGLCSDEQRRIAQFEKDNPEIYLLWILRDLSMTKQACFDLLAQVGIEPPAMYRLGYKNNNCIGCVKGGKGYWNKIRRDFPMSFDRMAQQERKMNARIFNNVWLDELPPNAGRYESEFKIECGVTCSRERQA